MKAYEIAESFIGQMEKPGNVFDNTTPLGKLLHEAGQKDGESWCCYFAEVCFCEEWNGHPKEKELRKLFSANCFQTFVNFLQAGYKITSYPAPNTLALYIRVIGGVLTTKGHAGIVTPEIISKTQFKDVEGNTSGQGSREGNTVAKHQRHTLPIEDGLRVLGFVHI